MESKIKGKNEKAANVLFNTTNGEAFKRDKGESAANRNNGRKEELIRPKVLQMDQLRTTWDEGASITLKFEDKAKEGKK